MDLQCYHRNLKIAAFFQDKGDKSKKPKFTSRSTWYPEDYQIPYSVKQIIKADLDYFNKSFRVHDITPNLTKEETSALMSLKKNRNIVIKPADKGSAVVIMDKSQYIWEGYRQLLDPAYYKKLDSPIYPQTIFLIEKILLRLFENKFINIKQLEYLRGNQEPRSRIFYLLPKIHKPPEKWSVPHQIPPGRPIVSDCGSESYNTAEYIE